MMVFFFGYSTFDKAYRVFNILTMVVEESVHISFIETNNLDLWKDYDETCSLLDALKKMNLDDSNKNREDLQSPQE